MQTSEQVNRIVENSARLSKHPKLPKHLRKRFAERARNGERILNLRRKIAAHPDNPKNKK